MPAITDFDLWAKAERDCFDYLLSAAGSQEGKDAFLGIPEPPG